MKVKKLIEALKEYNPDADCTLPISEDITISYISGNGEKELWDKKTTPIVFIEGADYCPICVHEYMDGDERWCSFYGSSCKSVEECFAFEELYDQG